MICLVWIQEFHWLKPISWLHQFNSLNESKNKSIHQLIRQSANKMNSIKSMKFESGFQIELFYFILRIKFLFHFISFIAFTNSFMMLAGSLYSIQSNKLPNSAFICFHFALFHCFHFIRQFHKFIFVFWNKANLVNRLQETEFKLKFNSLIKSISWIV